MSQNEKLFNFSEYLKIRDAALLLGVHPDTIRRWEKLGKIQTYRNPMNGYRLYKKEQLERLLAEVK